jgi:hypothetical protein
MVSNMEACAHPQDRRGNAFACLLPLVIPQGPPEIDNPSVTSLA